MVQPSLAPLGRRSWILGTLVLAALTVISMTRLDGFVADDAFILYRYAENIANGDGWAYNPGLESANAATSVLYTVLLAAAALVTDQLPAVGTVLTTVGLTLAGVAAFATLRRVGDPAAGAVAAVLLVTSPWLLSTRGMETPVFVALAACSLWAATADRPVALGLLLGLTILARADGVALALPLLAWWWVRTRRFPLVPSVLAGGVVTTWVLVAWLTIGSPLTNTLAGKAAQRESGFWGEGLLFLRGFVDMPQLFGFEWWTILLAILAALGLVAGLVKPHLRALTIVLASFALLHTAIYGLILQPPAYHWYYGPELFVGVMLGGIGVSAVATWLVPDDAHDAVRYGAMAAVVGVVIVGLLTVPSGYRYETYEDASGWIVQNTEPGDSIAATEIGVVGFRTQRPIVDYLGLLDEASVDELRAGDLQSWLARRQPEYWLVHTPAWPHEVPALQSDAFTSNYELVEQSDTFAIYRKLDVSS